MTGSRNYRIRICSDGGHLMLFDGERSPSPSPSRVPRKSKASRPPAASSSQSEASSVPVFTPPESTVSSSSRPLSPTAPAFIPESKKHRSEATTSDDTTPPVNGQIPSADYPSFAGAYFEFLPEYGMYLVQHGTWTFIPYPTVTTPVEHKGTTFYHTSAPYPFAAPPGPANNPHIRRWCEKRNGVIPRTGELLGISTAGRVLIELEDGRMKEIEPTDLGPADVEYLRDNTNPVQWALVSKAGVVLEDQEAVDKRLVNKWTLKTSVLSMEELGGPMEEEDDDKEVDEILRLLWEECEKGGEEIWV